MNQLSLLTGLRNRGTIESMLLQLRPSRNRIILHYHTLSLLPSLGIMRTLHNIETNRMNIMTTITRQGEAPRLITILTRHLQGIPMRKTIGIVRTIRPLISSRLHLRPLCTEIALLLQQYIPEELLLSLRLGQLHGLCILRRQLADFALDNSTI